jgi:hypothetical protein
MSGSDKAAADPSVPDAWHFVECIGCGKTLKSRIPDPVLPICRSEFKCSVVQSAPPESRDEIRRTLFWRPDDDGPEEPCPEAEIEVLEQPVQLGLPIGAVLG